MQTESEGRGKRWERRIDSERERQINRLKESYR